MGKVLVVLLAAVTCAGAIDRPFAGDDYTTLGGGGFGSRLKEAKIPENNPIGDVGLGLTYELSEGSKGVIPELSARYALLQIVDITAAIPYVIIMPDEGTTESGFGDASLGVKARLPLDLPLKITIIPRFVFPTGDSESGLGSGQYTMGGKAVLGFSPGNARISINGGYRYRTADSPAEGEGTPSAAVVFQYQITENVAAGFVGGGDLKKTASDEYPLSASVSGMWGLSPKFELDVGASAGLSALRGDYGISLGISYAFF